MGFMRADVASACQGVNVPNPVSPTALVVSADPMLAFTRQKILEGEGFRVTSILVNEFVLKEHGENGYTLLIFGHSVAPADKLRIAPQVKCDCIVELFSRNPIISDAEHCEALDPWKLARTVRALCSRAPG
jgi:hypothetical protein